MDAVIKKHFPKLAKNKVDILRQNLISVSRGLRPAFLFDVCSFKQDQLQIFLRDILTILKESDMRVFTVNEMDTFIINPVTVLKYLENSCTDSSLVIFVDISLPGPSRIIKSVTEESNLLAMLQSTSKSIISSDSNIDLENNWNGCTLYGTILGYPLVYYFSGEKNCLSMVDLIKCQVYQNNVLMFSFSFPKCVINDDEATEEHYRKWKENFKTKEEVVVLPSIIL